MDKPYTVNGRVLVVSDFHQRTEWFKAILRHEKGNYDHIVFVGDEFDCFEIPDAEGEPRNGVVGVKDTARFVIELLDGVYGPCTYLVGNHTLPYMESWRWCSRFTSPRNLKTVCSGFTKSKAAAINHIMTWEHWRKMKTFALVNGYLVSHAGFLPHYWMPELTDEANLDRLYTETDRALEEISFMPSQYFEVGECRGGRGRGGPYWCDFRHEFVDELPFPQLVGHTASPNTIRQIGRSYCIDGAQSTYAIVTPERIEFKSMELKTLYSPTTDDMIKDWRPSDPRFEILKPDRISSNWTY